jgi:flagellar basal body P-ring protein FlgI
LLAIAKGEIAVEIKKKVNKKKSSTDTFSGGVKKIKPQEEFILHQMRKSCYNYDTR